MTQAQSSQCSMVIQYGNRDEDDDSEYDSEDDRNNKGLFGGMLAHKRGSAGNKKGMGLGGLTLSNLGASMSSQLNFGGQSGDDDDDKSVASKAKKAFKQLGDSMRFSRPKSDGDEDDSSEEEDSDSDDDGSGDEMDDDRSVASRTAQAVRKVTGKLTKALRVGRRSDDDDSSVSDSDSEEEEEDPLDTSPKSSGRKGGILPLLGSPFSSREVKQDASQESNGSGNDNGQGKRRRSNGKESYIMPFRRSNTEQPQPSQKQAGLHSCKTSEARNHYIKAAAQTLAQEEWDADVSGPAPARQGRRSRGPNVTQSLTDPRYKGPGFGRSNTTMSASREHAAQAAAKVLAKEQFGDAAWSMNVTEDMLEQARKKGVFVPPVTKGKKKSR